MREGDAFFFVDVPDRHLWIIISNPEIDADRVLFLSLTSLDVTKENVCVILPGEHPFITHQTCVYYRDIKEASLITLLRLRDAGRLRLTDPVSAELLRRIREGISLSKEVKFKYIEFLIGQGVID
jgi:hypothetical protein